ncbi:MAG: hypothetical protein J2P16_01400 [Mycobacterium sp.]|nr:hypothetical protein [Mycobacterium sp.]
MEPVEINAGACYLLPRGTAEWLSDTRYTWAVCEATTGEPLADVALDPVTGDIEAHARDGYDDAAAAATESVRRFAATITNHIVGPPQPE